jgi:hypothetical protein
MWFLACFWLVINVTGLSLAVDPGTLVPQVEQEKSKYILDKGVKVKQSFRVERVEFQQVQLNNQFYLAAGVIFNRDVDPASVKVNFNIRLLRQEGNFWVDASTQNNKVNIRPNFITWVSGAPLTGSSYKMHLRGTIKSMHGEYLDCDGDGKGEGGNLPAYESQLYTPPQLYTPGVIQRAPDARDLL